MEIKSLNLFYEEPEADRWIKFDRYPRRIIRRMVRGVTRPGGHAMIAINLMKGLDKIGVTYRLNNYKYINAHPEEIACIIGKPHILFDEKWNNPILFGAAVFSHPIECPDLFEKYPTIKKILVPGQWAKDMFAVTYGDKVESWPVGTDTEQWTPYSEKKEVDFLLYDKIMWDYDQKKIDLLEPIIDSLKKSGLTFEYMRYGAYQPNDLLSATKRCKAAIFLCEHETQGLAYQQVLATGTPILSWDQGGYWIDPSYYPDKVNYQPVSSASYWDERCGEKFKTMGEFESTLNLFLLKLKQAEYAPRDYMLENLTLEKCAQAYVAIHEAMAQQLKGG